MQILLNVFKVVFVCGDVQIGLWFGFVNLYSVEVVVGVGFDWLLIDGEYVLNMVLMIFV